MEEGWNRCRERGGRKGRGEEGEGGEGRREKEGKGGGGVEEGSEEEGGKGGNSGRRRDRVKGREHLIPRVPTKQSSVLADHSLTS